MRELGHRKPLTVANGAKKPTASKANGHIESVVGRYVHLSLDGHDYRIFYEESGPADGIPLVLLHAANTDARMWRHQLGDPELADKYRLIAFDMPWRGRSAPPAELLRTEYRLSNDLYRRIIRGFCDTLQLDLPILVGCSMGGYICFYYAYHDTGRYRGFIAAACRDFEQRRWLLESVFRHPSISFSRFLAVTSAGFMAPMDPPEHADETAWLYETGAPRTIRGDLAFAALDCDARPFMGQIDTTKIPFYVLGGEYDWSCTKEHTDAIKSRMPRAIVVRMDGIGHFPPDENPAVFKKYLVPCLEELIANTS
ncbi:putative carboxylesterase protein [Rhizodiscina lignyota]|uniref:Carboxylesterase protein n=1 Tax=Rhizodiscina lignyota TaxID=1504668 RepID=A0A9P4I7K1_9PEZI|nr:putative carboxylesterase protein [Rhizodiscina lignyota]